MSTLQTSNLKNPSSGSNNIVLATDGSTTITTLNSTTITGTSVRGVITSGTSVASTSGTSIDFTGIPSWVKRVTVMFNGVSTNGTASYLVQLGTSSGFTSSGYVSASSYIQGASLNSVTNTSGFIIYNDSAIAFTHGQFCIATVGSNIWMGSGVLFKDTSGTDYITPSSGAITLSGTLDRMRITTTNGTDTFDAGSINILYEG